MDEVAIYGINSDCEVDEVAIYDDINSDCRVDEVAMVLIVTVEWMTEATMAGINSDCT